MNYSIDNSSSLLFPKKREKKANSSFGKNARNAAAVDRVAACLDGMLVKPDSAAGDNAGRERTSKSISDKSDADFRSRKSFRITNPKNVSSCKAALTLSHLQRF